MILLVLVGAARADLAVRIDPLLGQVAKANGFLAVGVALTTDAPWRGVIQAGRRRGGQVEVRLPVDVGRGTFHFDFQAPVGRSRQTDELLIMLVDSRGRVAHEATIEFQVMPPVTEWRHGLWQTSNLLAAWLDVRPPAYRNPDGIWHSLFRVQRLPTDWRLLWNVDVLVTPGQAAAALRPEQVQSILAWVRSGGRLVLDGAGPDAAAEANPLLRALGVTPGERMEAVWERELPVPEPDGTGFPTPPETNATAHPKTIRLAMPFRALHGQSARCLDPAQPRAVLDHGLGQVVLSGLDLAALARSADSDAAQIGLDWVIRGDRGPSPDIANEDFYHFGYADQDGGVLWSQALYRMLGLKPIPAGWVLGYLLVFILLVWPVERVLLRRLHRPHWMWLSTPLLAAVFWLAADALALAVRGVSARRASVCVHQYAAEGGGTHVTLECIVPARSRSMLVRECPAGLVFDVPTRGASARYDPRSGAFAFAAPVWSPRFLASLAAHEEPAPLTTDLAIRDGTLVGTVQVASSEWRLRRGFLTWNGTNYPLAVDGDHWVVDPTRVAPNHLALNSGMRYVDSPDDKEDSFLTWLAGVVEDGRRGAAFLPSFQPAPVPVLARGPDQAVIVAFCDEGPLLEIRGQSAALTARHVIRQVAPVRGGP